MILDILATLFLAIAYRFRGGGYINTGSDTLVRSVWALSIALMAIFFVHAIWFPLSVILSAFLSLILVPHGFAQNAGTCATPSWVDKTLIDRWPAAWMPQWTLAGWQAAPAWQRQAYDFVQMSCVGFFRGILVFGPFVAIAFFTEGGSLPWLIAFRAIGLIAILQGAAYQIGVHWMRWASKAIADGWWPEFLNGAAWAASMMVLQ